ncbi:hypothetical protein K9N50_09990 [bacterium]|nr:hypothetical protein [bacterium]
MRNEICQVTPATAGLKPGSNSQDFHLILSGNAIFITFLPDNIRLPVFY